MCPDRFRNVRCSVDCTEVLCGNANIFSRQANLFSSYKHHHTVICLIAVAPNGTVILCLNYLNWLLVIVTFFLPIWNLKPFTTWRCASGARLYHRGYVDGPIGPFKNTTFSPGQGHINSTVGTTH